MINIVSTVIAACARWLIGPIQMINIVSVDGPFVLIQMISTAPAAIVACAR